VLCPLDRISRNYLLRFTLRNRNAPDTREGELIKLPSNGQADLDIERMAGVLESMQEADV
jgi:hypothetical protein